MSFTPELFVKSLAPDCALFKTMESKKISVVEAQNDDVMKPFRGISDSLEEAERMIGIVCAMEAQMSLMSFGRFYQFHADRSHVICSEERLRSVFKGGAKPYVNPFPVRCAQYPSSFFPPEQWIERYAQGLIENPKYTDAEFECEIWLDGKMIRHTWAPIVIARAKRRRFRWAIYSRYDALSGTLPDHVDIVPYYRKEVADVNTARAADKIGSAGTGDETQRVSEVDQKRSTKAGRSRKGNRRNGSDNKVAKASGIQAEGDAL